MGNAFTERKTWPMNTMALLTLIMHALCSCSKTEASAVQLEPSSPPKRSRDLQLDRRFSATNDTTIDVGEDEFQASTFSTVPALFVFGDSTVDVGNNNNLLTIAQATFWPYGKDFDTHLPTGRFSNGRLSVDSLANFLGLPMVPAFASGSSFTRGANFASAGSGVLNDTGVIFGQYIRLSQQVENFGTVQKMLKTELGLPQSSDVISKSIYYISTGSNDLINNYLMANSPHSQLNRNDFQQLVLTAFVEQIMDLFKMGARKIVVASLPPLGCLPSQLYKMGSKDGECINEVNEISMDYNRLLADRLHGLRRHLPGVKLVYNDAYKAVRRLTDTATDYGIMHTNSSCCGAGPYGGEKQCMLWSTTCMNAGDHMWWDEFHLTAAAYKLVAEFFWSGSIEYSSPWNISTLATL